MNDSLRTRLQEALKNTNILALLAVIAEGESSNDPSAYREIVGGQQFDGDLSQHPRIAVQTRWGWSSAFGKYQIMAAVEGKVKTDTYDWIARELGPSMEPAEQDLKAVRLIDRAGALTAATEGRFYEAVTRCAKTWASLPGSSYGQPTITLEKATEIYRAYGGTLAEDAVPHPSPATQTVPEVAPMPAPKPKVEAKPMFAALLPTILQLIPGLISVFGSSTDSEVAKRNQAAGVLVSNTLLQATKSGGLGEAIDKMQRDPEVLAAATAAVHELLPQLMDVGGGVESARKFAAEHENGRYGRILEVVTYCAMFFLLLANCMSAAAAYILQDAAVMADVKQADIGAALIAFGYFLGSSISSKRKDEMARAQ